MFYAKSMYLGGTVIYAEDGNISYSSYINCGVCCLVCNEDVILKAGEEKRTHFAHQKSLSDSQCLLRIVNNRYNNTWSGFDPEAKEQRRKLFQEYFLNLIKSQDHNFDDATILEDIVSPDILQDIYQKCNYLFNPNTEIPKPYPNHKTYTETNF